MKWVCLNLFLNNNIGTKKSIDKEYLYLNEIHAGMQKSE